MAYPTRTDLKYLFSHSYLIDCYPRHVASVLAGNVVMRSAAGAVFPLFSNGTYPLPHRVGSAADCIFIYVAFFHHLGVGPACSVLGGIACLLLPIPFLLCVSSHRYTLLILTYTPGIATDPSCDPGANMQIDAWTSSDLKYQRVVYKQFTRPLCLLDLCHSFWQM